jgi:zinc protease
MKRTTFTYTGLALLCALTAIPALAARAAEAPKASNPLRIDYQKFVLDNGLTLIVHEDHKAPIVAVNVWYHVGSKNERRGKTGFAHLFEHLMFEGSEHYNGEFTIPFDRIGVTEQNATTSNDRTNYFENVPKNALDLALWMESDRMGHLLGVVSQARLDEQRGVVKNEKRQRNDQPYGRVFDIIGRNVYPERHPYSWPVIGSMKDLNAATLDDVRTWFKTFYGAGNAVLTIAGDVDTQEVLQKVKDNFGDIPAGPSVNQRQRWIGERHEEKRLVSFNRVPQPRIVKVWNVPETGTEAADYLGLASSVLSNGKSSRLYKRLVYEEQTATDVAAFMWQRELGSLLIVWATVSPDADPKRVEEIMDEEIARLVKKGPTRDELARAKAQLRASFIRGVESVGGFGGKADILAQSEVFYGSPEAYVGLLERIDAARPRDVRSTLKRWVHEGAFVLEVHPLAKSETHPSNVDRARLPSVGPPPNVTFPELERTTLANGLEIIVVEHHAVPVISFNLLLDAGYAADHGAIPGTAKLALKMLTEGTKRRSALEISDDLARLGAELSASSNLDQSTVRLSALREDLSDALAIYADVILEPAYARDEFERQLSQQLAQIESEKTTPRQIALRVLPPLLFGPDHAYGIPFTGSGTAASVNKLKNEDLRAFHKRWFNPNGSTLIVTGDTTAKEIVPKLEKLFKNWKRGETPRKSIAKVERRKTPAVYLIDRPGSIQSMVFAGHIAPPKSTPHESAIETMNELLGGGFNSRINRNLREDKHWSYGAHSVFAGAKGQRPFFVFAPVQTDKTADAMREIERELREVQTTRPPTAAEVERSKNIRTLSLPGKWETADAIAASVQNIVRYGFDDDYWRRYPSTIRNLTDQDVSNAANFALDPDGITWVVVGDRSQVESKILELGLGDITVIDADGNPAP